LPYFRVIGTIPTRQYTPGGSMDKAVVAMVCLLALHVQEGQAQVRTAPEPTLRTAPEAAPWTGVRICNRSGEKVQVAKALAGENKDEYGRAQVVSEGWWTIEPAACRIMYEGPIRFRYYYLYATSVSGKGEWGGDVWICVSQQPFTITGTVCPSGYNRRKFRQIDTGDVQDQFTWNIDR
jgi:uncharacterized membrane protein